MVQIIDNGRANTVVVERARTVAAVREVLRPMNVAAPGPSGPPGPPGPPGPSGGGVVTKLAAQAIGGHRMVRIVDAEQVDYASSAIAAHADDVLGMTYNAAAPGDELAIITDNEVVEPSWSWVPLEPVYLASNGLMTQTPPSPDSGAAFSLVVGFATSSTSVRIRVESPIYF